MTPNAGPIPYDVVAIEDEPRPAVASSRRSLVARLALLALCTAHTWAVWVGLGGYQGVTSEWPLARHDHPLYFHSARITPAFLAQSGTTAGYDPSFMAGYAKSVIFPASSTLPEVVFALGGRWRPVLAYKLYVLVGVAAVPWLVLVAGRLLGLGAHALSWAIVLLLIYIWTDFPIQYATFGMVPYFLAVPWSLVAVSLLAVFLREGGVGRWLVASVALSFAVLIHFTTAMVLVPSCLLAYVVALMEARRSETPLPVSRHLGFWLIPLIVLIGNAFWWWPGLLLASTKGESGFAFAHPEGVLVRLAKILTVEPSIQAILWACGIPGLIILWHRKRSDCAALGGLAFSGFLWGYLAGASRSLDFLQPGRHTYVLYSSLALASAFTFTHVIKRLRQGSPRIHRWFQAGLVLAGTRLFGPAVAASLAMNLADPLPRLTAFFDPQLAESIRSVSGTLDTFLSSRPTPRLQWVVDRVKKHVRRGERLLYEEGGFAVSGLSDPYGGGRFSGLLPYFVPGIEVLGGPYLHAALTTNFTQFGEGKLFGVEGWGRDHFERYARLYRPAAILCWSPHARTFCRDHPDLVEIVEDDGVMLLGRIRRFEGDAILGQAQVKAAPGLLTVEPMAGELDGSVVLRYHYVPYLHGDPPSGLEPTTFEDDPVPFIGIRPPLGTTRLSLDLSPWSAGFPGDSDSSRPGSPASTTD